MVKVVASLTVKVEPPTVTLVASGQYVVYAVTMSVTQTSEADEVTF